MSAHRYTDCRIDCDHEGCGMSEFGGNLGTANPTAAETRRILKRRGWLVSVPVPLVSGGYQRLDYCPKHSKVMAEEADQ